MFWERRKGKRKSQIVAEPTDATGFDKAKETENEDLLDRVRIADRVFSLMTILPASWSVRVGLLGAWGEGKTTISNWVSRRAKSSEHIVIWYNPWSARTLPGMWIELATEIMRTLDAADIKLEGSVALRTKLGYQKWAEVPRQASQAHAFSKAGFGVIDAAANFVGLVRVGPRDISTLRQKLGDRRVFVIIDDLDRTDPSLVPQLLLSLREVLDLPGFSFLLPFDDKVVMKALGQYNPALGDARFLEKILDFRIVLPPATPAQIQALFVEEMERHCPFLSLKRLEPIFAVLPENPRRLKALVRSLVPFRAEAERHRVGEVDWHSVVIALMIRMESEQFFGAYTKAVFGDTERNPWLEILMSKEDKDEKTDSVLERVLTESTENDIRLRSRLRDLCNCWREVNGLRDLGRTRYVLKMIDQPDAVTWAEYDKLVLEWQSKNDAQDLWDYIERQAESKKRDVASFTRELIATVITAYSDQLETAAGVTLEEEHVAAIDTAAATFKLLEVLADGRNRKLDIGPLSPNLFERLLKVIASWNHFRANPADVWMRNIEHAFLTGFLKSRADDWQLYLKAMSSAYDRFVRDARQDFIKSLTEVFAPMIDRNALDRLSSDGGIVELLPPEAFPEVKSRILDLGHPIWTPAGASQAELALKKARTEVVIQKNAIALLYLLHSAATTAAHQVDKACVRAMIANDTIIGAIWSAATAKPLQFRKLSDMRELRGNLIGLGASSEALIAPDWLTRTVS